MLIAALIVVGLLFAFVTYLCWDYKTVRAWTWFLLLGLFIFLLVQGWNRWLSG